MWTLYGFDEIDRKLMLTILEKYNGGPWEWVPSRRRVSEDEDTIEDIYEPYLYPDRIPGSDAAGKNGNEKAFRSTSRFHSPEIRKSVLSGFKCHFLPHCRRGTNSILLNIWQNRRKLEPKVLRLHKAIETVVRGKPEAVRLSLVCLLAEGHLLIEDVPASGKQRWRMLSPECLIALPKNSVYQRFASFRYPRSVRFQPGGSDLRFSQRAIFANIVLADEINRTTPKTQSALLEAMSEGKVSVDNCTHSLPRPFMVVATQNPIEHHGTYPLPESQLDRFLLRIKMGVSGNRCRERDPSTPKPHAGSRSPAASHESGKISLKPNLFSEVRVDESLLDYIMAIVEATRRSEFLLVARALEDRSRFGGRRRPSLTMRDAITASRTTLSGGVAGFGPTA